MNFSSLQLQINRLYHFLPPCVVEILDQNPAMVKKPVTYGGEKVLSPFINKAIKVEKESNDNVIIRKRKKTSVRWKTKDNFENKLLVYPVISRLVVLGSHKTPSGIVVNGDMYTDNCLVPYTRNLPNLERLENNRYIYLGQSLREPITRKKPSNS